MRALVLLVSSAALAPAALPPAIERYLRAEMELNQIPGLAVAVVRRSGAVELAAYGLGNLATGEPMTVETPVELASVSKPFTALAVYELARSGRLRLDAAVVEYLPEFRTGGYAQSRRILVRHLLEHTSGLSRRDDFLVPCCGRPEAGDLAIAVERMAGARLRREPGQAFSYANSNYVLLAALIERVGGEPFPLFMRRHVFAALSLERTTLDEAEAQAWGKATGYEWRWGRLERASTAFSGWYGASQVKSTAADMARFLQAMLGEQGATCREALEAARKAGVRRYGWGWFADPSAAWLDGQPVLEHGGDIWSGNAAVLVAPESGLGVAILINAGVRRAQTMARAVTLGMLGRGMPPAARASFSERPDNWAMVLAVASILVGLAAAVWARQIYGDLRGGERRLGLPAGVWERARCALMGGMALYLIVLPATDAMPPLRALPASLRLSLPLLCGAVALLLLVVTFAGLAPRKRRRLRPGPPARRFGSSGSAA